MQNNVNLEVGMEIPMEKSSNTVKIVDIGPGYFMAVKNGHQNTGEPVAIPYDYSGNNLEGMRGFKLDMNRLAQVS